MENISPFSLYTLDFLFVFSHKERLFRWLQNKYVHYTGQKKKPHLPNPKLYLDKRSDGVGDS